MTSRSGTPRSSDQFGAAILQNSHAHWDEVTALRREQARARDARERAPESAPEEEGEQLSTRGATG